MVLFPEYVDGIILARGGLSSRVNDLENIKSDIKAPEFLAIEMSSFVNNMNYF